MHKSELIFVVGEVFSDFQHVAPCLTFTEWSKTRNKEGNESYYVPGQGLTMEQYGEISAELPADLQSVYKIYPLTEKETHKNIKENILVSNFKTLSDNTFSANLLLLSENELLQDHITGIHLPGMIFLEATRQISVSAMQLYLNGGRTYLVMNDISAIYSTYAFPIYTEMKLFLDKKEDKSGNEYCVKVEFMQAGKVIVTTHGSFTVVEKDEFSLSEKRCAKITIKKYTRSFTKNIQP